MNKISCGSQRTVFRDWRDILNSAISCTHFVESCGGQKTLLCFLINKQFTDMDPFVGVWAIQTSQNARGCILSFSRRICFPPMTWLWLALRRQQIIDRWCRPTNVIEITAYAHEYYIIIIPQHIVLLERGNSSLYMKFGNQLLHLAVDVTGQSNFRIWFSCVGKFKKFIVYLELPDGVKYLVGIIKSLKLLS